MKFLFIYHALKKINARNVVKARNVFKNPSVIELQHKFRFGLFNNFY